MIQYIEKFRSKLHVESIRNSLDVVVLNDGEIELHQSGTNKGVSPKVSSECDWIWNREALSPDVVHGIPRVDQGSTARPGHLVRNIDIRIRAFHAQRVSTQTGSKRYAGAGFEYPSKLPSTQGPRRLCGRPLGWADFPPEVHL